MSNSSIVLLLNQTNIIRQKFAIDSAKEKEELVEQYASEMLRNEDDMEKVKVCFIL